MYSDNENNKRQKLNNGNKPVNLNKLPNEVLLKIGCFFNISGRKNLSLTNKHFKSIVNNLDSIELNILLPRLGFMSRKNDKSMTLLELRETYKQLQVIQTHCIRSIENFYVQANFCLPVDPVFGGGGTNNFVYAMILVFENLYSLKELVPFKINWAKVFDEAITEFIATTSDQEVKKLFGCLMQGVNEAGYGLLHIIPYAFKDPDCKDILEILIRKYNANFQVEGIFFEDHPQSIAYIQELIQQEQLNINNQP